MDFDVVVIGGGPGGYVAAIRASQLGHKVGLVEKEKLGGVCLNWGCIPTKTLLKSAEFYENITKKGNTFGIQAEKVTINYEQIIHNSRKVAERLSQGISFLMKKNNISVIFGKATLEDPHTIQVEGKTIRANYIILATGAKPRELPHLRADGEKILNSRHALSQKEQPRRIAIVGGGAIGVEFAYFWNALGSQVTLIEMMPRLLPMEDEEISKELAKIFQKKGIHVRCHTKVTEAKLKDSLLQLTLVKNGQEETLEVDQVLLAIGVAPRTEELGLEKLGIQTQKGGWIQVNEYCQTSVPNIYAIGDVNGPPWLAHVASYEGILAVEHLSGKEVTPLDKSLIPACTYCNPQVASVGYTEAQAREKGYQIKVGKFPLRASGKALAAGEKEGFVKVILDAQYGELLGCHILASEATELISEFTLGRTGELTYHELLQTIHPHPTLSEAIAEAVHVALSKPIHI